MSDTVETVKVVADNEQGFKIINKSDLTGADKVYVDKPKTRKPKTQTET